MHSVLPCYVNGSSPQVRGTFVPLNSSPPLRRFIPAGAGNIPLLSVKNSVISVHPRRCGEHTSYNLLKYQRTFNIKSFTIQYLIFILFQYYLLFVFSLYFPVKKTLILNHHYLQEFSD